MNFFNLGLSLAYPYTIVMNGTRLGLYEYGKHFISRIIGLKKTNMLVGMISGKKNVFRIKQQYLLKVLSVV